jgi:lysozyme
MDLPPVLDVEEEKPACGWRNYQTAIQLALQTIELRTGRKPMIYTNKYYWSFTNHPTWAKDYPLWVASYIIAAQPVMPVGWSTWNFWQYSEAGKNIVNPYDGVDLNLYNGEMNDLLKFCGHEPDVPVVVAPVEPPVVEPGIDRLPAFLGELKQLVEKYG